MSYTVVLCLIFDRETLAAFQRIWTLSKLILCRRDHSKNAPSVLTEEKEDETFASKSEMKPWQYFSNDTNFWELFIDTTFFKMHEMNLTKIISCLFVLISFILLIYIL